MLGPVLWYSSLNLAIYLHHINPEPNFNYFFQIVKTVIAIISAFYGIHISGYLVINANA